MQARKDCGGQKKALRHEYSPTQTIAELFRSEGYDGVAYKSAFGEDAYSIALFDIDSAKQLNGAIYKTKSVDAPLSPPSGLDR
jgi:RES domain